MSRRLLRRVWVLAVLPSLAACRRASAPVQIIAPSPTPPARDVYVSNLTGVAFGSAFARATSDGAPATENRSSGGDEAIDAAASADGDEVARSCRRQGTRSHAQATAEFQPLSAVDVRQFGFTLSTTTYARGGALRDGMVLCRSPRSTTAVADARATGRIDLTFGATGSESDQLVLRVSGATPQEAQLEVRDGQGQLLPLTPVAGETSVAAALTMPGPYSVSASIASHAEHGASADAPAQRAATFTVSVQSMKDARALGQLRSATRSVMLPLPVFMSTEAMNAALDSALFTDQHRLYPCAKVDCRNERMRDVYLETPRVSTERAAVVLEMRLSGSYQLALGLGSGVSGTIRATAVPVVERDTLRFEAPSIDVATHNLIVKWRSAGFERKLLDRLRNVRIDLTPRLRTAVAMAQQRLSGAWGGACLLLAPKEAHLRSVRVVTTAPQGIVANFGVELSEESGSDCETRRASR